MKSLWIAIFLFFGSYTLMACDICGCGVGSYYLGILPEFNKRFIGLRYQHKELTTHLGPGGRTSYLTSREHYQTVEIWGAWNLSHKFRILYLVPYNFNRRQSIDTEGSKNGLGDVALMGYYNLLNKQYTIGERILVHSLWIGAGIKAPTGNYEPTERSSVSESPNTFQLGTASTDFTFNLAYDIRLMDIGLNLNLNYKVNTANRYAYRYGNKFTSNALVYYKYKVASRLTIAPNIGFLYETSRQDIEDKQYPVDVSGGHSLAVVAGLETTWRQFAVGANYQHIAEQHLGNQSIKAADRFMIHTSFSF